MGQKETAVRDAAQAVIDHGGPECRTDPRIPMDAMSRAYDLGATPEDIKAEMHRQRETG